MARSRNIKPGFFQNEILAELSPLARLAFIGLWTLADREGRLEDRPRRIGVQLFPYDPVDIDAILDELAGARDPDGSPAFIMRYEAQGGRYITIRNFVEHQTPHHREKGSTLPPPPLKTWEPGTSPGQAQGQTETSPGLAHQAERVFPSDSGFPDPDPESPTPFPARAGDPDALVRSPSEAPGRSGSVPSQGEPEAIGDIIPRAFPDLATNKAGGES